MKQSAETKAEPPAQGPVPGLIVKCCSGREGGMAFELAHLPVMSFMNRFFDGLSPDVHKGARDLAHIGYREFEFSMN